MNALALVIGNVEYIQEKHKLVNAVNDANDLASKLMTLGFTVQKVTNCDRETFERSVAKFGQDLKNYQVGLFYFSGHGLQIKGQNYLTSIDTSFADTTSAKHTSYPLDEVIEYMQEANPIIKILILDACRDNSLPSEFRSTEQQGLAPIHAPKGTIIAFSTSPGEKAMDYGAGRNSIYTGSLLTHIDDPGIPIEDFFKRVRTSVYNLSKGKQTSWEHTSLIGNFYFNSGQLVHSIELPYRQETVVDQSFKSTGSAIDVVIEGLKSHDWYKQNPAIEKLRSISSADIDSSSQFLLGRNILQTAIGEEFAAQDIMANLATWISKYSTAGGENHVLNGMLFEMYFNSKGLFRKGDFKSVFVDELYALQTDERYRQSFIFIKEQLLPFKDHLFYLPNNPPEILAIEALVQPYEVDSFGDKPETGYKLESLKHENVELLHSNGKSRFANRDVTFKDFRELLKLTLCVPLGNLRLSTNIPERDIRYLSIPWNLQLSREAPESDKEQLEF